MANLYPSLVRIILPRLGQQPSLEGGLRQWLEKGTYTVGAGSTQSFLQLEQADVAQFVAYSASDFERFSFASWESVYLSNIEIKEHQSYGWPLLKLYYGAFFAAHAIMRSVGEGIVKIEFKQARFINQLSDIVLGHALSFSPGMYSYVMDPTSGVVEFKQHSVGAGVHDGFWRAFKSFLERRSEQAAKTNAPDASDFIAGVSDLTALLSPSAGQASVWLSATRNEINYQQGFGVWFPSTLSNKVRADFGYTCSESSGSIRLDTSLDKKPIVAFIKGSLYLGSLCREVSEHVAARSSKANAFGSRWRHMKQRLR